MASTLFSLCCFSTRKGSNRISLSYILTIIAITMILRRNRPANRRDDQRRNQRTNKDITLNPLAAGPANPACYTFL